MIDTLNFFDRLLILTKVVLYYEIVSLTSVAEIMCRLEVRKICNYFVVIRQEVWLNGNH